MNTRRRPVVSAVAWLTLALVCAGIIGATSSVSGQQFTTLVAFTNVWKYDRSGLDLGTAWRTNDYDDSTWASGPGVLGFEDAAGIARYVAQVPSGFGTLFPPPLSQVVTTYYFRTTFLFDRETNATQFFATNLVDDGCAIWLNGELAGTVRLPTNGVFNAATTAEGGPLVEGTPEVLSLRGQLRQGLNQLAVEVHQNSPLSGDVAFAMQLAAVTAQPLVITNQPLGRSLMVGDTLELRVDVSGGPVSYRWQRDGVNLSSTSNRLIIANMQLANAGNYRVICSNSLTVVTSAVATVEVIQDLFGPKVVEAIVDNSTVGRNGINVRFSEPLALATAREINNYRITHLATGSSITITNVLYNQSVGALLQLNTGHPNWVPYDDYVLTINNVADVKNNLIAPNTRVSIGWIYVTNLISSLTLWDFHDIAFLDPGVYEERWQDMAFVPGPWWGLGQSAFQGGVFSQYPCANVASPQIAISYQIEPTLFRASFQWPDHWSTNGTLRLRFGADDGLVLYLNGVEVHRHNVAGPNGAQVTSASRAATAFQQTACVTNISLNISNLAPGRNLLAAAVVQSDNDQPNSYFVFDMTGAKSLGPALPAEPQPELRMSPASDSRVTVSWLGSGYSLEASTNLDLGPLSYPSGPWFEVPQMSNPYSLNTTNGPLRFFRLRK